MCKKALASTEEKARILSDQVSRFNEECESKDRKIGLLDEQVGNLKNDLEELREKLGNTEMTSEEEKQALLREINENKKKIEDMSNDLNNLTATASEKQIKVEEVKKETPITPKAALEPQEEMKIRKTTSYEASISILEKSVRGITEIFYDKFRNIAYFN